MLVSRVSGFDIERWNPNAAAAASDFQRRMFGDGSRQADPAIFAWRFFEHPYGGSVPDVWLARKNGVVLGQQAGLALPLVIGGTVSQAIWAIDLMIDPHWRLRGVAPVLTKGFLADRGLVAGLGISDEGYRYLLRLGWCDVGLVPRFVKILGALPPGPSPEGGTSLTRFQAGSSGTYARAWAARDGVEIARSQVMGFKFQHIPAFDSRMDVLFARLSPAYGGIADRGFAMMSWRFDRAPQASRYRRFVLTRKGEIQGYGVLRLEGQKAVLVDHLCAPDGLNPLLAHCANESRRCGAKVLTALASDPISGLGFRQRGFLPRPGPRLMVWSGARHGEMPKELARLENWYLTYSDSDLDH